MKENNAVTPIENGIPVMATMAEAGKYMNLPYHVIRQLCLAQKIKFIRSGTKFYVYMDSLIRYCEEGEAV